MQLVTGAGKGPTDRAVTSILLQAGHKFIISDLEIPALAMMKELRIVHPHRAGIAPDFRVRGGERTRPSPATFSHGPRIYRAGIIPMC